MKACVIGMLCTRIAASVLAARVRSDGPPLPCQPAAASRKHGRNAACCLLFTARCEFTHAISAQEGNTAVLHRLLGAIVRHPTVPESLLKPWTAEACCSPTR